MPAAQVQRQTGGALALARRAWSTLGLLAFAAACAPDGEGARTESAPSSAESSAAVPEAARSGGAKSPRLVVMVAACSVNRDYIAPYDESVPYTPNIAQLLRGGVVFRRHVTEAGQSGTSFASILTGTQAYRHGVYHHPTQLSDSSTTLMEAFAGAGWSTYYWGLHPMASASLNYAQGVPEANQARGRGPWSGEPIFERLVKRLKSRPRSRALIVATPATAHSPYTLRGLSPKAERFLEEYPDERGDLTDEELHKYGNLYAEHRLALQWDLPNKARELGLDEHDLDRMAAVLELHYKVKLSNLDTWVGTLLRSLKKTGLLREALIVFTADHGEILYRDNAEFVWSHGLQLAPEVLTVPFVISAPMLELDGRVYEGVSRSIDVFPTLAGLCGVELGEDTGPDGVDLSPVLLGHAQPPRLQAFFHSTNLSEELFSGLFQPWENATALFPGTDVETLWVGMRDGDIVAKKRRFAGSGWGYQVFDLGLDPEECTDLYDPDDPRHAGLIERLEEYKALMVARYGNTEPGEDDVDTPEALEKLRSLGYIK